MSAYVVENETINRIVAGLLYNTQHPRYENYTPDQLEHTLLRVHTAEDVRELGEAMFKMNLQGVKARYSDLENKSDAEVAEMFRPGRPEYTYFAQLPPTQLQLLKSINCLTYQCCEGDIPETRNLYKQLVDYALKLAFHITIVSKAYDALAWE